MSFSGFSRELPKFLGRLTRNNDRDWFETNRDAYETHYLNAAKEFVAAVGPELQVLAPVHAEPRVNGAIMKINRDVRFSKDKRPYKDGLHLMFTEGPKRTGPGFYLRIAAKEWSLGAGLFGFTAEELTRYRQAVIDRKHGPALRAAFKKASKAGDIEVGGSHYKRVPSGFDANHPNADFLLHKGLWAGLTEPLPDALFGPKAVSSVVKKLKPLSPVQRWVAEVLG
jgi:uncharacterized protein (TIGR02453 family)